MKRSDMIVAMTEHWLETLSGEEYHGRTAKEVDGIFEEVSAKMSSLLNMLESRGMKPPVLSVDPVLYTTKHVWDRE